MPFVSIPDTTQWKYLIHKMKKALGHKFFFAILYFNVSHIMIMVFYKNLKLV